MPRADNGREIVSQILAMSAASMERDQIARNGETGTRAGRNGPAK